MTEKLKDIAKKLKILKNIKDIGRKNINKNKKEKKFDKNNLKINKMETKNGRRRDKIKIENEIQTDEGKLYHC